MPVPAGPGSVITVDEVASRLRMRAAAQAVAEDKIQAMIDAAEAEYEELVGPITEQNDVAVVTPALLPDGMHGIYTPRTPLVAITSITDGYGTTVDTADYIVTHAATGLVRPAASGAISLTTVWPSRVVVSYIYGGLPANHREFLIAEIAGYYAATQRAGDERTDANGYADGFYSAPTKLFPRIADLASRNAYGVA